MTTRLSNYQAELLGRRWLSPDTFELTLARPAGFQFQPGQYVSLHKGEEARDYSPVSAPNEAELALCIRRVGDGRFSTALSKVVIGSPLTFSGPKGYFTYKTSHRTAVWVATGSGIAPFCSMTRAGAENFILLHGVRQPQDLYYADLFQAAAGLYVPCVSDENDTKAYFQGRVTEYMAKHLPPESYDFYLCGRRDMVRDVTLLVDDLFPKSLVYSEVFY